MTKHIKLTKENLTQELLKKLISYDPETGHITRNVLSDDMKVYFKRESSMKIWNSKAGERMDRLNVHHKRNDYKCVHVSFFNCNYIASRLIFLYMTGSWPQNHVDHINGDSTDNRWENLRDVTCAENLRNQKIRKNNGSGKTGVDWNASRERWQARGSITVNGKQNRVFLGYFDDLNEAIQARRDWEEEQGNFTERHKEVGGVLTKRKVVKLTQDDVEFIRTHYKPRCEQYGMNAFMKRFGISKETVRRITNGYTPKTI